MVIEDFNVTVVGLGLIGGSFARKLIKLNPKNVWGVDVSEDVLRSAENMGIINKGYIDPKTPLKNSDLVIICLYPDKTISFIADHKFSFKANSIVTDATGVKSFVFENIKDSIRTDIDFIGGHPMAGKETSGFESSADSLFDGTNFILTPNDESRPQNIEFLKNLMLKIGFKKVTVTTPQIHDGMIAYTSQLAHVSAVSYVNACPDPENIGSYAGNSFHDSVRVATINGELWSQLFADNSDSLVPHIDRFIEQLTLIRNAVHRKDTYTLKKLFEQSNKIKERLQKNA